MEMFNYHTLLHKYAASFGAFKRYPKGHAHEGKIILNHLGKPLINYKSVPRITQSDLILALPIVAGQNQYQFPLLTTDSPQQQPFEVRLDINDEFTVTEVGVALVGNMLVGSTGVIAARKYWTYAPWQFDNTTAQLENFWEGVLNYTVDGVQIVKNWSLKKHHVIPRTNEVSGISQGSVDWRDIPFIKSMPNLVFSGAKTVKPTVTLATPITPVTTGSFSSQITGQITLFNFNFCLIIFRGWLAQNGAKFQGSRK